jgi:transcriptional regulator with XRE-family HTH domain
MRTAMATRIGQKRRLHLYIREWMEHRGLSDERLANRLGVARETVYRWRTEQHRLNPEKIAQLASALDCEPQDLYRLPSRPSLDAMVAGAPDELQAMVADVVRRMVGR